jgi:hypothetical protein
MTKFSFSTPISLETYIDSGQPLNIIDELTDQTLLIYVCDKILNSNPNNYQLWVNIALKILDFPPDQILLNYAIKVLKNNKLYKKNSKENKFKYLAAYNMKEIVKKFQFLVNKIRND